MLMIELDGFTQCLKDCLTGEIVETEAVRIKRSSFLSHYNVQTGWYINWNELLHDNQEVYALVIKGTVDIQGMVAVSPRKDYNSLYVAWAVAAPQNNKKIVDVKKYDGVGGHLLAIAAQRSMDYGFGGAMFGYAANKDLVQHYCDTLGAQYVGILHPFHVVFPPETSRQLLEVYSYDWTDEVI